MNSIFIIVATIIFLIAGVVWSKDDWRNVFIKLALIGMAIWGGFLTLQNYGYVVQNPAAVAQPAPAPSEDF